jgi:hypothetical protein
MDAKIILSEIHGATFNINIRKVKKVRDIYGDFTKLELTVKGFNNNLKSKDVFEWILSNLDYDYKTLLETKYSNEELCSYFRIYYKNILFKIEKYLEGTYTLNPSDFDNE